MPVKCVILFLNIKNSSIIKNVALNTNIKELNMNSLLPALSLSTSFRCIATEDPKLKNGVINPTVALNILTMPYSSVDKYLVNRGKIRNGTAEFKKAENVYTTTDPTILFLINILHFVLRLMLFPASI